MVLSQEKVALVVRNPQAMNAGDASAIPGSGRSPGGGNDNPLQSSCLENPTARGAWWATVHGVSKSRTRLSTADVTLVRIIRTSSKRSA